MSEPKGPLAFILSKFNMSADTSPAEAEQALDANLAQMEADLSAKDGRIADLDKTVSDLTAELEISRANIADLNAKIEAGAKVNADVLAQIETIKAENDTLKTRAVELNALVVKAQADKIAAEKVAADTVAQANAAPAPQGDGVDSAEAFERAFTAAKKSNQVRTVSTTF